MVLSGPIQSWPSRRLSGVKRTCPEASEWAGDDPKLTSEAQAHPLPGCKMSNIPAD